MTSFVHLKARSAYSLAEGAVKIPQLVDLALAHQMPALALTDWNNMFGVLEFSLACAEAGVQPIVGAQICFDFGSIKGPMTLLAQSQEGYQNLMGLMSRSYLESSSEEAPILDINQLYHASSGLIVFTGGEKGPIYQWLAKHQADMAHDLLRGLKACFGDRALVEISRLHGGGAVVEEQAIQMAYDTHLPLIATNEVFFSDPKFHESADILQCVSQSVTISNDDRVHLSPEAYFKSPKEMNLLFQDLPEALENTVWVAQRCHFMPKVVKPILPPYPLPEGQSEVEELKKRSFAGLKHRLEVQVFSQEHSDQDRQDIQKRYEDRLVYEIGILESMGFPGYFLIVADFIQWAKQQNIPVGPGRGSGAGSLVAWCLTITDIDPIRFGLIFERFLNPERVSMPDFDVDFCQDRRDEVIDYVCQKYGQSRVAHIITFGKLQARAVLRDVGRVLEMPYPQVDRICKLVPQNPANPLTLEQALGVEPQLTQEMESDPQVRHLIEVGRKLEGLYRHASTHAAGIVIGDRPLSQLVPLYRDAKSPIPATQFSMKYAELAGLMKFDFLGLKTLTVIQKTCDLIKKHRGIDLNITTIPLDDQKTFELLNRVEATGIFQLESGGMRDVLRQLKPDQFEDLIALVALYRPGPMDDIPRYLACKHGLEPVKYLHPLLEPILKESYGVMVVQEQVMKIAQDLAGYSLGGADLLRRAMGKKNKKEMADQEKRFVTGAVERGVAKDVARLIFEQISKFAGYGFNKSHAAPYALISYQTAYLKANFTAEFLCASLTLDMHNIDKVNLFRQEVQRYNIPLLPPDVNFSETEFSLEKTPNGVGIRYGLGAVKNVGIQGLEALAAERKARGPYKSLADLYKRAEGRSLNKRQLESLICAGVMDSLSRNRRSLFEGLTALAAAPKSSGASLFGEEEMTPEIKQVPDWPSLERLQKEFAVLGFYLSDHPLSGVVLPDPALRQASAFLSCVEQGESAFSALGVVISSKEKSTKNGQRYAFVQMSDPSGQFEIVLFSEMLTRIRDKLQAGSSFFLQLSAKQEGESLRLTVQHIEPLESKMANLPLNLSVSTEEEMSRVLKILKTQEEGVVPVRLTLHIEGRRVVVSPKKGLQLSLEHRHALMSS